MVTKLIGTTAKWRGQTKESVSRKNDSNYLSIRERERKRERERER
jgi:hypothetical protein